jgi:hypothetical protein
MCSGGGGGAAPLKSCVWVRAQQEEFIHKFRSESVRQGLVIVQAYYGAIDSEVDPAAPLQAQGLGTVIDVTKQLQVCVDASKLIIPG